MWLCLKAGPEPGMKFTELPISNSDDSEGSLALGQLVIQTASCTKHWGAGWERMWLCVPGWRVGRPPPTSRNPRTWMNGEACQRSQSHLVFKNPSLMTPNFFLSTRTVESNRKEELQGKAALFCFQSLGQPTQRLLDTCGPGPGLGAGRTWVSKTWSLSLWSRELRRHQTFYDEKWIDDRKTYEGAKWCERRKGRKRRATLYCHYFIAFNIGEASCFTEKGSEKAEKVHLKKIFAVTYQKNCKEDIEP